MHCKRTRIQTVDGGQRPPATEPRRQVDGRAPRHPKRWTAPGEIPIRLWLGTPFAAVQNRHTPTNPKRETMETHFPNAENSTSSRIARERVMSDMLALARDAENLLKATASDVSEKAREARTRLMEAVENAKTTCSNMQAQGIESAREAAKKADETIRAHPYESLGVAFGIGVLLGALIRRK